MILVVMASLISGIACEMEDGLGAWVFLFYHAALMVVFQTKDGAI